MSGLHEPPSQGDITQNYTRVSLGGTNNCRTEDLRVPRCHPRSVIAVTWWSWLLTSHMLLNLVSLLNCQYYSSIPNPERLMLQQIYPWSKLCSNKFLLFLWSTKFSLLTLGYLACWISVGQLTSFTQIPNWVHGQYPLDNMYILQ